MKKTTRPRKRPKAHVIPVRVMSPRIAWFSFLKILGRLTRYAAVLALVTLAGWGAWKGIRHAFYENPDFQLRSVELNQNSAIDIFAVYQIGDIDPNANLFNLDLDLITERLLRVPALSSVKVQRHLPGTLSVRVTARTPYAWVASSSENTSFSREIGALMIDETGHTFPCTTFQFPAAQKLPVILLPPSEDHEIAAGKKVLHPELARCTRLLDAATATDPEALHWIESIRQANTWSLELTTRAGITATFGLGDHERQIANFRAAIDHAARENYAIATINLIPRENVPVTVRHSADPPRAVPVQEPTPTDIRRDRRERDLNTLLNSTR